VLQLVVPALAAALKRLTLPETARVQPLCYGYCTTTNPATKPQITRVLATASAVLLVLFLQKNAVLRLRQSTAVYS
jgi:hypothetical protein